ncbi:YbaB/EbfC family nucleoid-associated protein [Actinomadura opuntiae]|uniref:YbaB/EbfC family nucleoid-associated protein n=1 Tax=Actinomadura sp. OS1-43 TaxID=604315 RepID=UPI003342CE54
MPKSWSMKMSNSDEIADSVRALGNLVDSLQAETKKVAANARQNIDRSIEIEIRGGLGTVEVNGLGQLRQIHLDPRRIRRCSAEEFGRELVRAVNAAAEAARSSLRLPAHGASAGNSSLSTRKHQARGR